MNKASYSGEELVLLLRLERNVSGVGEKVGQEVGAVASLQHEDGRFTQHLPVREFHPAVEQIAKAQFRKH